METIHDGSHLTLDERKIIQTGIENRSNKISIAKTIGKDPTTIAKEIRKHRELRPRNTSIYPSICIYNKECGGCKTRCSKYKEKKCNKRDRSPGACNKCSKIPNCHLDKCFYYATKAHDNYLYDLSDSRSGINLTTNELKQLADIIVPLVNQGQSFYQIKVNHKEIKQTEKTLYNYIEDDIFHDFGITNLSLKEKVKRKLPKKLKKRKDPVNYDGRKYDDYLEYILDNPNVSTTEMDTVYNNPSGPYIQTFIFEKSLLMFGFLHNEKTSQAMASSLDTLEDKLGHDLFRKLFPLLLTDRGTEFEKCDLFEFNTITGEARLKIFYCDPMASHQKPHVENNHNYVRDIIPNEISLEGLNQNDINMMFSHINSTPRESLGDKTPYELFEFLYSNDKPSEILELLNIKKIEKDKVVLKPYLLKKPKK